MATYYEIMSTDLSKLTTAADAWDAMAKDFGKLAESYKKQVHGISLGDTWIGVSATAGSARFDVTQPGQSMYVDSVAVVPETTGALGLVVVMLVGARLMRDAR